MEQVNIDPQRQEQARRYARLQRRLMLVELGIGLLYVLAWLLLDWSQALKSVLLDWTSDPWLLVAGFGLVFGVGLSLLDLPLSYYSGYILPHRFGLSNQTLPGWISDQVKGALLAGIFGGIVLEIIYGFLRQFPETWWLWTAAFLLVFNVILANLAPVLLMPIFYKFVPLSQERHDLAERLVRLAEKAGARVRGVYQFDMSRRTKAANAALTGLGNTRRIILGDTLLNEFSDDEIETVLAHELGHHVHKDIPIGILVESGLTLAGLYLAALGLRWGVSVFGFSSPADIAALPVFMLVIGAYSLVTMPLGNAFSRWRERRADAYALHTTQKPRAFASAMTRLANQNLAELDPEPWVVWLLYSHPPLKERIARALQDG
jgi:STE24 endopeptidase